MRKRYIDLHRASYYLPCSSIHLQMEQQEREKDNKYERDPTLAAKEHGNAPSKGARIDAELAEEDRKTLEKKGIPVE